MFKNTWNVQMWRCDPVTSWILVRFMSFQHVTPSKATRYLFIGFFMQIKQSVHTC